MARVMPNLGFDDGASPMICLDHMILRVRNQADSVRFYQQILAFQHEGRADPFDILRVHEGFTLDLMEQMPQDQVHLAFCLERAAFEAIHWRLIQFEFPVWQRAL
jgi:catechol 2,3-dioxygenase-like lactoylglutathione lyase family enzyme